MTTNTVNNMHTLKVQRVNHLTSNIMQLFLEPSSIFSYQAGDYLMLGLDQAETKPFSIANAPQDNGLLELHVRNLDQTEWMQRLFKVQPGDTLWADGPKPQMKLQHETDLNIYIAGGTGIAPIKALLEQRLKQGLSQPTKLYWGARRIEEFYIHDSLLTLAAQDTKLTYIPVLSENDPAWSGEKGLVHEVAIQQNPDLSQATVYLCGAWAMVQTAETDLINAGLPTLRYIH